MKKTKPLLFVLRRIRKRLPSLIMLIFINIANGILSVSFAMGMKNVIDCAVAGQKDAFIRACVIQGSVVLLWLLNLQFNRHLREKLTAQLDRDWKKHLFRGLLYGDYGNVSAYHTGELINRFNNDVKAVDDALMSIFPNLAAMVTQLVAAIIALASMEPVLTGAIVACGVVVVVLTGLIRKPLKRLQKRLSREEGRVSGFCQEILEKLLMVQAMDVAGEIEERSGKLLDQRYALQIKRKRFSMLSAGFIQLLTLGAGFAVLVWGSVGILHGTVTYGTLTALIQLVAQVRTPMVNLSGVFTQYVTLIAAAERLMELESIFGEPAEPVDDPQALYEKLESIQAEKITFAYDRDPVFQDADISIPKGEFGVITGHSGIGKSTLLKLLLGIFRPQEGALFLKTQDAEIPLDRTTRGLFAYVPQGNLLLSGTLRENLLLTRPQATEEEIRQAVYISCMDDYLDTLPQGLETVIGENAMGLSEGQAQRLSIARAVLSQAPVMLLDEATSALDPDTEQMVLSRLLATGRTCIAVTHRPAAVEMSSWQLEMRDGTCVLHTKK